MNYLLFQYLRGLYQQADIEDVEYEDLSENQSDDGDSIQSPD